MIFLTQTLWGENENQFLRDGGCNNTKFSEDIHPVSAPRVYVRCPVRCLVLKLECLEVHN